MFYPNPTSEAYGQVWGAGGEVPGLREPQGPGLPSPRAGPRCRPWGHTRARIPQAGHSVSRGLLIPCCRCVDCCLSQKSYGPQTSQPIFREHSPRTTDGTVVSIFESSANISRGPTLPQGATNKIEEVPEFIRLTVCRWAGPGRDPAFTLPQFSPLLNGGSDPVPRGSCEH